MDKYEPIITSLPFNTTSRRRENGQILRYFNENYSKAEIPAMLICLRHERNHRGIPLPRIWAPWDGRAWFILLEVIRTRRTVLYKSKVFPSYYWAYLRNHKRKILPIFPGSFLTARHFPDDITAPSFPQFVYVTFSPHFTTVYPRID